MVFIRRCVKLMLPIRKDEVFVPINFSCSETFSENLWQADPGSKHRPFFSGTMKKNQYVKGRKSR